jgi:hypothetical protein
MFTFITITDVVLYGCTVFRLIMYIEPNTEPNYNVTVGTQNNELQINAFAQTQCDFSFRYAGALAPVSADRYCFCATTRVC